MTTAEKLTTIAENEPKIYDKGHQVGYSEGHNEGKEKGLNDYEVMLTGNYKRTKYKGTFGNSDFTGYTFKETIYPVEDVECLFYAYLGTELPKNISLEKLQTDKSAVYYRNMFGWALGLTKIPDIGLPPIPYYQSTYLNCKNLIEIEVIRCTKETVFNNPFFGCDNLTTFKIEGEIGTNFDCSQIPVSPHTMHSIVQNLVDYSGTSNAFKYSVLFSQNCWDKLNENYPVDYAYYDNWEDFVVSRGWSI